MSISAPSHPRLADRIASPFHGTAGGGGEDEVAELIEQNTLLTEQVHALALEMHAIVCTGNEA